MKLSNQEVAVICACIQIVEARIIAGEMVSVDPLQLQNFMNACQGIREKFSQNVDREKPALILNG